MDYNTSAVKTRRRVRKAKRNTQKQHYMGFQKLESQLSGQKGVSNPAALAASIGRAKYGAQKYNAAAAAGKKLG